MNILKSFYHRTRREFVSLMASEVARRTKRGEAQCTAELVKLARNGLVIGVRVPHHSKVYAWELTPAGKAQAEQIIRAEAMARSV